ncbi:AAA family ATPase [Chitinophaga caseinilytica]|uniref:AAA family ATPase n=1 Tax=Chitinophaga caseinilytica TaxID=2267521 RepID=A0ABZ2ZAH1_9BACT
MWTLSNNKSWEHLEQTFAWVRDMAATPQDPAHHAEGDVAVHTRMVLEALCADAAFMELPPQEQEVLWAAALLHDVEKRSTTIIDADGSISSPGHARKGALTARNILYRDIPAPFAIREQVVALVRYHGFPLWALERPDPVKELVKVSLEADTRLLAILARADVMGRICGDRDELLYRIDCFEAFCQEQGCWGTSREFATPHARMHYLLGENAHPDYVPFNTPIAEVVVMSGLPGAGKDTFIRKHFPELPLVSLDGLRNEMDVAPTDAAGNGRVIQAAKERARAFLRRGEGFVWNATNTTRQMRTQLLELFYSYGAQVRIVYVEVPWRQLARQNGSRDAVVPALVLEKLAAKLEVPAAWEAHLVTWFSADPAI